MKTISIRDAKNRLTMLAREVEAGQTITVTRSGKPVFDLVPHRAVRGGIRWDALEDFKRKHKVKSVISNIADDFDAPLPPDFLLRKQPKRAS